MVCERPTVYIVDDDSGIRRSLSTVMDLAGYSPVSFDRVEKFLEAFEPDQVGCLLLDIQLPGMTGLDLLHRHPAVGRSMPTIILTGHGDVGRAVDAIKSGAMDFLEKPIERDQLLNRVQLAMQLSEQRHAEQQEREIVRQRLATLTSREQQLLSELISGKSNKQIAGEWYVSLRTIENHRAHLMKKMHAKNIADLVRMATAHGE